MNQKIIITIVLLLLILVVLYLTGKKSVHHEITINATSDKVWNILTDMEKYEKWNPVMKLVDGEIKEGNKVTYEFTQDEKTQSKIPATIQKIIKNELLNQSGGIPLILTYNHKYILESEGNQTKVIIHEDYEGIGVNFWNPKPVQEAYGRLNNALKNRVESLH